MLESHPHRHEHSGRDHDEHARGLGHLVRDLFAPHSHDAKDSLDQALEGSRDGVRAVAISLVILLLTAGVQALVVVVSGSVALLGDTFHNGADALTALPLWMAFSLGRPAGHAAFHLRIRESRGHRWTGGRRIHRPVGRVWPPTRPSTASCTLKRSPICRSSWPRRSWGHWGTRSWRSTESGPGGGSDQPLSRPMGFTPERTASPHCSCSSEPSPSLWDSRGPTRSWDS